MNICMVVGEFPPNCGGIGIYVHNLSKNLVERGHKVVVITRGTWNKCIKENLGEITLYKVFYLPVYPFHVSLHGFFLKNQFKLFKNNEFDIIHFHSPLIPSFNTKIPTISTVHGTVKKDIDNKESKDLESIFTKFFSKAFMSLESEVIKNSDIVTTVSESCTNEINNVYNLTDKAITVNNGVDSNFFAPKKNKSIENPYILYTGRLDSRKGLLDLVKAAKDVYEEYPNIQFILVGNGSLGKYLKKEVSKLGLNNNFRFVGFVPHAEILEYYQNSTIYVTPSYYEGLPTTLLEAMSCGIASIATDVEGNSELIKDGENGLLVPPRRPELLAEAIIKLVNDENLRKNLGKNARNHIINNYDWNIITDNFEQIYKSISHKS